jgi:hypothetical protein
MAVDVEEALNALILGRANVQNLVQGRVFPNRLAQGLPCPAVITRRVAGSSIKTLGGVSSVRKGIFQIESWSSVSQAEARQLDKAVQEIEGFRGPMLDWWIQALLLNPDADQDEPQIPTHADDLGLFCSTAEFFCIYRLG